MVMFFLKKYGSNFDEEYEDEIESFLKEKEGINLLLGKMELRRQK